MKKKWFTVFLILLLCLTIISCDKDKETEEKGNTNEVKEETTIKGETYEAEDFTMTIAEGFSKMDIDGGVQAYKGNDVIEVWVRGFNNTEADAKNGAENLAKTHDGTEVEKIQKFGIDFYVTTFESFGNLQTVYVGLKNGKKIQIGIMGKDYQEDELLQGMFNSISFK